MGEKGQVQEKQQSGAKSSSFASSIIFTCSFPTLFNSNANRKQSGDCCLLCWWWLRGKAKALGHPQPSVTSQFFNLCHDKHLRTLKDSYFLKQNKPLSLSFFVVVVQIPLSQFFLLLSFARSQKTIITSLFLSMGPLYMFLD